MNFKIRQSTDKYYWIYLTEIREDDLRYKMLTEDDAVAHYLNLSPKEYSQILYGCNALYVKSWGLMFPTMEDAELAILLLEPHLILTKLTQ
jgi:hypothetical protein